MLRKVSIPFKREGTCEPEESTAGRKEFCVSIPFKREGTCEHMSRFFCVLMALVFQFPSNGKVHVNSPYFAPSRAVAPYTQKQTRTARGFFSTKIWSKNPINPCKH